MSTALRARFAAQLLSGPSAGDAGSAVGHLLAIQGQDPRGFRLAVRARTTGVTAADVDAALDERRLVVAWLNRGTLHLVRAEDYGWLHEVTTPQLRQVNRRRLEQEGVEQVDRAVGVVLDRVAAGPATREELRPLLVDAGLVGTPQGLVHVLFEASLRHRLVRGPLRDKAHAYVLADDWLPHAAPEMDRADALAALARRYLNAHGPAADRDLAYWANLPLRDARAGLAAIAADTVSRDGLVDLADRPPPAPLPRPRLLGNFDPVLHGWVSRDAVLGAYAGSVVLGGVFRSFALVDGHAAALWSIDAGRLRIRPLEPLTASTIAALTGEAHAVLRFLGLPETHPVVEAT